MVVVINQNYKAIKAQVFSQTCLVVKFQPMLERFAPKFYLVQPHTNPAACTKFLGVTGDDNIEREPNDIHTITKMPRQREMMISLVVMCESIMSLVMSP